MTSYRTVSRLLPALLCVAALLPAAAYAAPAGSVVSSSGRASILSAEGQSRPAQSGASINAGETAVTGEKGQINLRFSDDSLVQLHAQSRFRIDQYTFNGKNDDDPKDSKGFFSLLKGGMRTVTGLIGKYNRAAYRVSTSSATIGIRGTEYTARIDNGLHVNVERGEISLSNRAGNFAVSEGQRAYIADQKSAPKYLNLSSAAQAAAAGARNGSSGGTQIQGNTQINASAINVNAVAVGQGNTATNKAGAIGGK